VYVFERDGTYRHAGVLLQERPSGTASFERGLRGTVSVTPTKITLKPAEGTQRLRDPDVPSANFDKPIEDLRQERYAWELVENGGRRLLSLTDSEGATIEYAGG
jgi:hypothetical protein